jgi:hypothetical protein
MIAGITGAVAMNTLDLLSYYFHFDQTRFIDFASVLLYSHKPTFWWDTIVAGLAQVFFSCGMAIIFIYLLPIINTKNYLFKGAFFSVTGWFAIYTIASIYKIPEISQLPWQSAVDHMIGSTVFGLVIAETIRRLYAGKEEWSGQTMDDRFTEGFIAGGVAGIVQILIDLFIIDVFHFGKFHLFDYAAVLIYGKHPSFWFETILAQITYLAFTCIIGIIFAYLILFIGSKYYLLKGWFFAIATWFFVFAIGTMYRIPILEKNTWQDATNNFFNTSIFGIVMAIALKYLTKDFAWKRN